MPRASLRCEELANADRIWHLRQSGLMEGLAPAELEAVLSGCTDRIYLKEEIIFDQGDLADSLFILNRGCVRVSVRNHDNRERILDIYTTGILGENLLSPKPCFEVRATAHEESWVSIISRHEFVGLIQQRTSIALNYGKLLYQRLVEAREDIKADSFLDIEHKLGKLLLRLSESYGRPIPGNKNMVKLRISLSHRHLAQLVGADRSHVSTILTRFRRKGWTNYQGRKLLINRQKIEGLMLPRDHGRGKF